MIFNVGLGWMNNGRCFYRRIQSDHLEEDGVTVIGQAFMPRPSEKKKGAGPSVIAADLATPQEAMMAPIGGQIQNWCLARGGHLAEFPESALPDHLSLQQEGKDPAHHEIRGAIYADEKDTYEWAYRIAAQARIRFLCIDHVEKDVLPGVPPCSKSDN